MVTLLLLLVSFPSADAAKRRRADVQEPRGPAPAVLPAVDLEPPYPFPAPTLHGPTSVLALQGLTRDAVSFRLETDLSSLSGLEPQAVDAIFAQLAADPRWRVSRAEDGTRVAVLREGETEPDIGPGGWHLEKNRCFRVALRESVGGGEWATSERVTRVSSDAGGMDLEGFRPDGGVCARLATAVRVEGTLILEVFEAGPPEERPVTIAAVGDLPFRLTNLRYAVETIARDGYDALSMPDGEPSADDDPSVEVAATGDQLEVSGRMNPGAPGWTWIRVLGDDGQPWEERAVALGTLEQVGWSLEPSEQFYLQGALVVPSGSGFDGTAEVWFQPDPEALGPDDEPGPRVLHSQPVTIPPR